MKDYYDVIISGMGPAGLACALVAAQDEKKNILIISNREEAFLRVQKVILDLSSVEYLQQLIDSLPAMVVEENAAIKNLKRNLFKTGIALKDIERGLYECVKLLENIEAVFSSELSEINMEHGTATVDSIENPSIKKQLSFSVIIGADGSNHHTADIYNASCSSEADKIHYSPSAMATQLHPWHFSCRLILETKDGSPLKLPKQKLFASVSAGTTNTDSEYFGAILLDKSPKQTESNSLKLFFSGEISEEQYLRLRTGEGHEEAMIHVQKYVTEALSRADFSPESIDNIQLRFSRASVKSGLKKDGLKWQTFKRDIVVADQAIIEVNGNKIILAGDAYRSPDYQIGHGVNDALFFASYTQFILNPHDNNKWMNESPVMTYRQMAHRRSCSTDTIQHLVIADKKEYAHLFEKKALEVEKDIAKLEIMTLIETKNEAALSLFFDGERIEVQEIVIEAFSRSCDFDMLQFIVNQAHPLIDINEVSSHYLLSGDGGVLNRAILSGAPCEFIVFLLSKGVKINTDYENHHSSLRKACIMGQPDIVRLLLSQECTQSGLTTTYIDSLITDSVRRMQIDPPQRETLPEVIQCLEDIKPLCQDSGVDASSLENTGSQTSSQSSLHRLSIFSACSSDLEKTPRSLGSFSYS